MVEIKNNNLTLFNIDALFQKEFRLKTVKSWNTDTFQEFFSPQVDYSVVLGKPLSGKTSVCNLLAKHLNFQVIDFKAVEEKVRKGLGTEDEPFEGDVPLPAIAESVIQ